MSKGRIGAYFGSKSGKKPIFPLPFASNSEKQVTTHQFHENLGLFL